MDAPEYIFQTTDPCRVVTAYEIDRIKETNYFDLKRVR
jgi:hypothetical protein